MESVANSRLQPRLCWFLLCAALCGCGSEQGEPVRGIAYAGPDQLSLWADLAPHAAVAGVAAHGEKLEILEYRRRFVRVRMRTGATGWTDADLLLTERQTEAYQALQAQLQRFPSMGAATVHAPLNIHIAPHRQAPSFAQIPEGGKVEIIGHCVAERGAYRKPIPTRGRATAANADAASDGDEADDREAESSSLPRPLPPPVPEDWLRLSRPRLEDFRGDIAPQENKPTSEASAVPSDDWYLVRTPDGRSGWALARQMFVLVPDEIAQYAERQRITSYFPAGETRDGGLAHPHWLWTTIGPSNVPYQFDSVRYFVWSRRRHRYETAYVERRLRGYYPVELVPSEKGSPAGFKLIVERPDGSLERRIYQFQQERVRLLRREPFDGSVNQYPLYLIPPTSAPQEENKESKRLLMRWWRKLKAVAGIQ